MYLRQVCLKSDDTKLIDNFVLKSDEETNSAEEQAVSNMFTLILIARTIRKSSLWRLLFCIQVSFSAKKLFY